MKKIIKLEGLCCANCAAKIEESVKADGEEVTLTIKEYEILYTLLSNKGTVFTRDMLLQKIWGYDYDGENRTKITYK